MNPLPRATPDSTGLPATAIQDFLDSIASQHLELHSYMIVRQGAVVAEGWWYPYHAEDVHLLYSLSKSFTSAAFAYANAEGLVSIEDPVLSFFPAEAPLDPSDNLRAMKVRHLLTMSTGHDVGDLPETSARYHSWVEEILDRPVPHPPGTTFLYNNSATYLLSAILHKVTRMTLSEYLRPRLFDLIGIRDAVWAKNDDGIEKGATGLRLTTESVAKFGLLLLQKGNWGVRRVLPPGWVDQATQAHIQTAPEMGIGDWGQGYGYQFWRCRHDAFRGDGAFGQNCIVIPDHDMVVVTTAGIDDLQALLDCVWETLLRPKASSDMRISRLELPQPAGSTDSPRASKVNGIRFAASECDCQFDFSFGECRIRIGSDMVTAGMDDWALSQGRFMSQFDEPLAASARWSNADTLEVKVHQTATPTSISLTARFDDDGVAIEVRRHATFEPAQGPRFYARRAG